MCAGVCAFVCVHAGGSQTPPTPFFLNQGHSLAWNSPSRLGGDAGLVIMSFKCLSPQTVKDLSAANGLRSCVPLIQWETDHLLFLYCCRYYSLWFTCIYASMCIHMYVEARGQLWVLLARRHIPRVFRQSLSLASSLQTRQVGRPGIPWDLPFLALTAHIITQHFF